MSDSGSRSSGPRVLGWLLILVGGAWTLLSGGCTLIFLPMASAGNGGDLTTAATFLGIGAVCILPGLGLLYGGWVILRKPRLPGPK